MALEQPERADALFLDRVSVEINDRLRLIAAEESLERIPAPTPDGMRCVLELLRQRFNYVVMDLPAPATLAEMEAFRMARHHLVVMTPDLASIRDADRLRRLRPGPEDHLATVVLNRVGRQGGLKLPLIEQGLGGKPAVQIPEFGKQLGRAANLGKPALEESAAFRKAIALLTQEVSGATAGRASPARGGALLGWILSR
jgi:pilus assembly protein CpaE